MSKDINKEGFRVQAKQAFARYVDHLGVGTGRNSEGELEVMLLVDGIVYTIPFEAAVSFHLAMADALSKVRKEKAVQ